MQKLSRTLLPQRIGEMIIPTPRLQCSAGHGKHLGRLPLGETLGVQFSILYKQVRAFETSPALVAIIVATLLLLDDRFHRDLLFQPVALTYGWLRMAR
jgi:hypothetical protein